MKFFHISPKRIFTSLSLTLLGMGIFSPPHLFGQNVIYQSDFSNGVNEWKMFVPPSQRSKNGSIEAIPGVGHDGGPVLQVGGDDSISYSAFKELIPVEPGQHYKITAWFQGSSEAQSNSTAPAPFMRLGFKVTENSAEHSNFTYLSGDGQVYTLQVAEWNGQSMGKWFDVPQTVIDSLMPKSALGDNEWNKIEAVVEAPPDAYFLDIALITYRTTGKVRWEGIRVEQVPSNTPLSPINDAPIAAMSAQQSAAESAAIEAIAKYTVEELTDPGLITPVLNTSPLPKYSYENLDYGMTIGIERSPGGRLWAAWIGGGDNDKAYMVVANSDDDGETWNEPSLVIDPHDDSLPLRRRVVVGNLWKDPDGRLWLFFDQSMGMFDGRAGNWYTICDNPDAKNPTWSKPVRISYGCTLNKPTVLANGDWLLPVSLWPRRNISFPLKTKGDVFSELDQYRMANVFVSSDKGKTWVRRGGVAFPAPNFDEHMMIERRDGSIWMTARTREGMYESTSTDGGKTWSEPIVSPIKTASARHFITRLKSGKLLLIKHGERIDEAPMIDERLSRSHLTAFLSEDDGATWQGGLLLDERTRVSYPDGFQAPDGTIYISWDWSRNDAGEVRMARFTEEDIMAGSFKGPKSRNQMLISRPNPEAVKKRKEQESKAKSETKQGVGA